MPVSEGLIEEHVQAWEAKLGFGHRRHWPSRLFRHEALENAIKILELGSILSRNHATDVLQRDVAPDEIINSNHLAHRFARLYFRPRTPTQYRIEGIRKPEEIWNDRHAPVIFMFVFKSRILLNRETVHFSKGNMQVPDAEILDGDDSFRSLIFEKIYHEGSYGQENADIKVWRCAEVLIESPLVLDESLEAIVCRSDAERKTLIFMLGDYSINWADKIMVMTQPGFFNAEYAFVESVDLAGDGVKVRFHPRVKAPVDSEVRLSISNVTNPFDRRDFRRQSLDLRVRWNFAFEPEVADYLVEIEIEGELAYRNTLRFEADPF